MNASAFLLAAAPLFGGTVEWTGETPIDSVVVVQAGDTLRIRGPAKLVGRNPSSGILVRGVLLVDGDDSGRVEWAGGAGVEVASGGEAFLSGWFQEDAWNGLHVSGGQATVWASRLRATPGRPAAILSKGSLVVAGSHLSGRSPVLVGWQGTLELDDVVLVSDTLWRLDPKVQARFQDVQTTGTARIGQDPMSIRTHADTRRRGNRFKWLLAPVAGTRIAQDRNRREAAFVPLYLSMDLGTRFRIDLLTGWRSGWLDGENVFSERDQSLARLQVKVLPVLDLGAEIGYGGAPIAWNDAKSELAVGLLDRGMDLEEPFVAPGPLGGGRIRLHGRPTASLEAEFGTGYQWRGESGSTDLGDLVAAWATVSRSDPARRTGVSTGFVWCFPDRIAGLEGLDHWQWSAALDHRRNLKGLEWGGGFALEGRDDGLFAQRLQMDVLFGSRSMRIGPAMSGTVAEDDGSWSAALGPGLRFLRVPSPAWRIEAAGYVRAHRGVDDHIWIGGDLSLRLSGGF